ncbi:MAG: hypothetical protein ACLQIB_03090 [Isosphaeraceae bacterium]
MTKVAMFREDSGADQTAFRALTAHYQAVGRTAGEALDALTTQLGEDAADTLIIVRSLRPDQFFTLEQRQRLEQLMGRWRLARDAGQSLSADEQSELELLIDCEVRATTDRARALINELAP